MKPTADQNMPAPAAAGPDHSTIDLDRLAKLPKPKLPPTHHLSDSMGSACMGDPPGFPSYLLRHVYTAHGNTPGNRKSASLELLGHVVETGGFSGDFAERKATLRRLYKPLPFDHPRVQAWVASLLAHFRGCYRDTERLEYGKPGTLIFPVPDYKLKTAKLDPNWTDEYKATVSAEAEAFNRQERERAARIAVPDNHLAVLAIRGFYPDFVPGKVEVGPTAHGSYLRLSILDPATLLDWRSHGGQWWETEAERPTPATCQPRSVPSRHPEEGWCQWCGYTDGKETRGLLACITVPLKAVA